MNASTITARATRILDASTSVTATLSQFGDEHYLLTVYSPPLHFQIHLDGAGIENLKALLAEVSG